MEHKEVGKRFKNIGNGIFARVNDLGNVELAHPVVEGKRMKPYIELILIN